jgi:hypothetical protein
MYESYDPSLNVDFQDMVTRFTEQSAGEIRRQLRDTKYADTAYPYNTEDYLLEGPELGEYVKEYFGQISQGSRIPQSFRHPDLADLLTLPSLEEERVAIRSREAFQTAQESLRDADNRVGGAMAGTDLLMSTDPEMGLEFTKEVSDSWTRHVKQFFYGIAREAGYALSTSDLAPTLSYQANLESQYFAPPGLVMSGAGSPHQRVEEYVRAKEQSYTDLIALLEQRRAEGSTMMDMGYELVKWAESNIPEPEQRNFYDALAQGASTTVIPAVLAAAAIFTKNPGIATLARASATGFTTLSLVGREEEYAAGTGATSEQLAERIPGAAVSALSELVPLEAAGFAAKRLAGAGLRAAAGREAATRILGNPAVSRWAAPSLIGGWAEGQQEEWQSKWEYLNRGEPINMEAVREAKRVGQVLGGVMGLGGGVYSDIKFRSNLEYILPQLTPAEMVELNQNTLDSLVKQRTSEYLAFFDKADDVISGLDPRISSSIETGALAKAAREAVLALKKDGQTTTVDQLEITTEEFVDEDGKVQTSVFVGPTKALSVEVDPNAEVTEQAEGTPMARVIFEVAPDPADSGVSSLWKALDTKSKFGISNEVGRTISQSLLNILGIKGVVTEQIGSWRNNTNPSFAIRIQSGENPMAVAKGLGFALSQEAMAVISPASFEGGEVRGAVTINHGLTDMAEIDALYQRIRQAVGEDVINGQSTVDGEMIIVLDSGVDSIATAESINEAIQSQYNVSHSDVYAAFPSKEEYNYEDQATDAGRIDPDTREGISSLRSQATGLVSDAIGKLRPRGRRPRAVAQDGTYEALPGTPNKKGTTGPIGTIVEISKRYAKKFGIPDRRQGEYVEADPEFGKRLADAYDEMKHDPTNPEVKRAYEQLVEQTIAQYEALVEAGYEFYFYDETNDPYEGNPYNAIRDLRNNKRMAVFSTVGGYGQSASELDVEDNPLLAPTPYRWSYGTPDGPKQVVLANDLFRAVHDAFGHGLEGAGFRARGEENAWQSHVRLYYGDAVAAMTSETRGQNSWVNFGPESQANKGASASETIYAEQKIGLLPEWAWTENVAPDAEPQTKPAQTRRGTTKRKWTATGRNTTTNEEHEATGVQIPALVRKIASSLYPNNKGVEIVSRQTGEDAGIVEATVVDQQGNQQSMIVSLESAPVQTNEDLLQQEASQFAEDNARPSDPDVGPEAASNESEDGAKFQLLSSPQQNQQALSEKVAEILDRLGAAYADFEIITDPSQVAAFARKKGVDPGRVQGAIDTTGKKVYINLDNATLDTPVHEFAHLFIDWLRINDTVLYKRVASIFKDPNNPYHIWAKERGYKDITTEAMAQAIAEQGSIRPLRSREAESLMIHL